METAVLIPNYNGFHHLEECLKSLRDQTYQGAKIIVVDDGSTKDDADHIRRGFPEVDVVELKKNEGFAKAVNAGLRYAIEIYNPHFIAVLNNDTKADERWLAALVARMKGNGKIAAVTSNMFFHDHPDTINSQGGTIDWNGDGYDINFGIPGQKGKKESGAVLGACWGGSLVNTEALKHIGFLDERFGAYFEDLDWSWRANLLGWEIIFEHDAILYHKHSASYKDQNYRKLFFCKKNALRAALKNWGRRELRRQVGQVFIGYWFAIVGYLQTNKHQMPLRKKLLFMSIPPAALFWNILFLSDTLKERRTVQKKRKVNDDALLNLIRQDTTPVREWLAHIRKMFLLYTPSPDLIGEFKNTNKILVENSLFLLEPPKELASEIRDYFDLIFVNIPFQPTVPRDERNASPEELLINDLCFMTLELSFRGNEKSLPSVYKKSERIADRLKSRGIDWSAAARLALRQNASSQAYFLLKNIRKYFGAPVPEDILRLLRKNGSRIQNALLSKINFEKFKKNKSGFFFKLYSKSYLEEGIFKYLVTRLHESYNRKTLKRKTLKTGATPRGINIFGFLDSESGLGEGARLFAASLERVGIPFALLNTRDAPSRKEKNRFRRAFTDKNPYFVNMLAFNGDVFREVWDSFGEEKFKNRYNIAYWVWELPNLPSSWIPLLDRVKEIWTPSTFAASALNAAGSGLPVTVIPHAIYVEQYPHSRAHFGLPRDKFLFLFMFDFYSIFERKNPLALIEAFRRAFMSGAPVGLVIKCMNGSAYPEHFRILREEAAHCGAYLISESLTRSETNGLMNACDAYVSLHRAEGFGLTIAEAMAFGKPVIATNYSGNTDFLNEENGFPVDFKLVELEKDYGPYMKGSVWAEPDIDHAAAQMRLVLENEEVRKRHAAKARGYIDTNLNPGAVGEKIRNRLRRIRGN